MLKSLLVCTFLFSTHSFANVKADEAAAVYAQRDYNAVGIDKTYEALELFNQAIVDETNAFQKLFLNHERAVAYYFLGTALDKKEDRMAAHKTAMDISDDVVRGLGLDPEKAPEWSDSEIADILNQLNEDQEYLLADALYSKGTNLGQWGRLNGIATSIDRLPIVLGLMERIEKLGYEDIHSYGPARTVGRANFILPKIFGGDLEKSENLLKKAYKETLFPGTRYSVNGYNNLYLAETMYKRGKENQAIRILETFVAADPATLSERIQPENREAVRLAEELLVEWN